MCLKTKCYKTIKFIYNTLYIICQYQEVLLPVPAASTPQSSPPLPADLIHEDCR